VTATLRDVARTAGVSISTASRALSADRSHPVAPGTRDRIFEVVRELNYEPNNAAQRLVRRVDSQVRRTYNIGLVLGEVAYKFSDPFWSTVLEGVDEELIREEYHLRFAFSIEDLKRPYQRQMLGRTHVDGLILLGGVGPNPESLGEGVNLDRAVLIEGRDDHGRWLERLPTDIIATEKRRAMGRMVDHLMALGRRRLVFLGPSPETDERGEAFLDALARHGLGSASLHCVISPWQSEGAYEVAKALCSREPLPDAIVCGSDTIAIGAMRAAKERGLALPDDLAITGFDDIAFARDLDPPLTTIHVPKELIGELAVRKLIERINHPGRPSVVQMVPTKLVVRRSCGAPGKETTGS
jgi:DNA-binding LacI/PurR family transcriptional regulator